MDSNRAPRISQTDSCNIGEYKSQIAERISLQVKAIQSDAPDVSDKSGHVCKLDHSSRIQHLGCLQMICFSTNSQNMNMRIQEFVPPVHASGNIPVLPVRAELSRLPVPEVVPVLPVHALLQLDALCQLFAALNERI